MNRIKELRRKKGISQSQLAKQMHTNQANISAWELEKWQPDQETLKALAKYFGVSIDYLLGISDCLWTPEDYANGVVNSVKMDITANDLDILDKYHEIEEAFGEKGKNLIIDFCDILLEKAKK